MGANGKETEGRNGPREELSLMSRRDMEITLLSRKRNECGDCKRKRMIK